MVDGQDCLLLTVQHCIMNSGEHHLRGHNSYKELYGAQFSQQGSWLDKAEDGTHIKSIAMYIVQYMQYVVFPWH